MKREDLVQKSEMLRKQKEEAIATVNAISGAIQFAEQLIAEMDKAEVAEPAKIQ